ncbi:MAG TPA: hypothetical protein VJ440_14300, partial [Candidatus Brocadiaceae bacterium]|nr:hypothetical protein [Candidatus Brocadiaceae bacterium]
HCPSLWAAIRDGRYVYSCRSAFVLTPAFRLGFVMTTEWALALTEGIAFVKTMVHAVWGTKKQFISYCALSGLVGFSVSPGRCPGLSYFAPSGLTKTRVCRQL